MKKQQKIDLKTFNYLRILGPKRNRHIVMAFLFILLDVIGVLPLLGTPFSPALFWTGAVPAIIMNVWGLFYIFAPFRFEKSYFLFVGALGVVMTFVYFTVIQKFLYLHIGVESNFYFFIGFFLFLALLVSMWVLNQNYFFGGSYYDPDKKGMKTFNPQIYIVASGAGYLIAQIMMSSFVTDSLQMIFLIVVMGIMSVITAFFTTYLHRYLFIHKNERALKNMYPEFGLSKKARKFQDI